MRQERFSFLWVGIIIVLVAAGFSGLVWLNYLLVDNLGGGETLFNSWYGLQGFLSNRFDPYDQAMTQNAQAAFGQDINFPRTDLPFYFLLIQIPALFPTDFLLARAIWAALAEIALVALAVFNLRLTGWRQRPLILALYLVFMLFSVPTVLPFLSGDPIIWLALLITLALWSLRNSQDELAGALLALSTFKWQVAGLFIMFVFIWVMAQRRWRVLAGFGMSLVVLAGIATLTWPGWFLPFARAVAANLRAGVGLTPGGIVAATWPGIGEAFGWVLTATLGIILLIEWMAARRKGFRHFLWAACLTLAVTPLIGLGSNPADHLVLSLPLTLFLAIGSERWMRAWGSGLVLAGLLTGLWFLAWRAAAGSGSVDEALFFPLPVVTLVGLYWVRWWAVRAPVVRPGSVLDEDL
jgi:hypothetical protein